MLRNLPVEKRYFDEITLVETETRCRNLAPLLRGSNQVRLLTSQEFENSQETFDAIYLVCVLHIIPEPARRRQIVKAAVSKLRPGGFIVVDVPQSETYYNRRKRTMVRYKDGYLLRWGQRFTFYKSFYSNELDELFRRTGCLELDQKIPYSKHLIRVWRKTPGPERRGRVPRGIERISSRGLRPSSDPRFV